MIIIAVLSPMLSLLNFLAYANEKGKAGMAMVNFTFFLSSCSQICP